MNAAGFGYTPTFRRPAEALRIALDLAAQGLATFPLAPNKRPMAGSRGHLDASRDPARLRDLWPRFPGPLVGIATGSPSGLVVLDPDLQHADARRWWREHGHRLPAPLRIVRTPSGGLHVWFAYPAGGLRSCKVGPHVDLKADGGFACAWHRFGGPLVEVGPLVPMPAWLLALAQRAQADEAPPPARPRRPRAAASAPAERRIAGAVRWITAGQEGDRNRRLFRGACLLRDLASQGLILDAEAQARAVEAGRAIGLADAEARKTVASAWRYPSR